MTWWLIEAGVTGPDADRVARALVEATGYAVEERPDLVLGYAADQHEAERARRTISEQFGDTVSIELRPAPTTDWTTAWKQGLAVRTVGRLRLGPSWLLEPGPDTIVIDPETAFGSGEHGSTRGALTLLDRYLRPGATVLDLGSGSGILTIGAIKLGAARALGIEVDEEAIPIAEQNAVTNGVAAAARFVAGDAAALAPLAGPADLVVANILRTVNEQLVEPIARALGPGGVAVFAGIEVIEAPLFDAVLDRTGYTVIDRIEDEGWWSVAARPPGGG